MRAKFVCGLLASMLLATVLAAEAQQPTRTAHIGFLTTVPFSAITARTEAFREGLRAVGYVEGKSIVIEWRSAEGKQDRLPALATELVRLNLDVIVSAGSPVTRALKRATSTIPIVMGLDPDPVANGFVANLARPEGNITGLSTLATDISGKQLEILKEIIPKLSRVAILGSSTRPGYAESLKEAEKVAAAFRIQFEFVDVKTPDDIETAFRAARKGHAEAVLVLAGPVLLSHRTQIANLAAKNRLPAISERAEFMDVGGLMVYGASITEMFRRIATYVDKILKGAKPADLPVEQPTKFEFLISLKAAKQIGLTIPPNVLVRADRVIR